MIPVDVNNQDIGGCLVGPSGERVCPLVAVGSDGRSQVNWTKTFQNLDKYIWQFGQVRKGEDDITV